MLYRKYNNLFFQDFDPPVSALDMFQWWDMKSHTMNTGLLTIQSSSINWHHLNSSCSYKSIYNNKFEYLL